MLRRAKLIAATHRKTEISATKLFSSLDGLLPSYGNVSGRWVGDECRAIYRRLTGRATSPNKSTPINLRLLWVVNVRGKLGKSLKSNGWDQTRPVIKKAFQLGDLQKDSPAN